MRLSKLLVRLSLLAAAISSSAFFSPAWAHHGTQVNYDYDRTITVEGTVTEFNWRNPHASLFLDITDASGKVINYALELPSPVLMARGSLGWSRETFKPGDHVKFIVYPSRTDAPVGNPGCTDGCNVWLNGKQIAKQD